MYSKYIINTYNVLTDEPYENLSTYSKSSKK